MITGPVRENSVLDVGLNAHWFTSFADAAEKLEDWRRHCNDDRPIARSDRGVFRSTPP